MCLGCVTTCHVLSLLPQLISYTSLSTLVLVCAAQVLAKMSISPLCLTILSCHLIITCHLVIALSSHYYLVPPPSCTITILFPHYLYSLTISSYHLVPLPCATTLHSITWPALVTYSHYPIWLYAIVVVFAYTV